MRTFNIFSSYIIAFVLVTSLCSVHADLFSDWSALNARNRKALWHVLTGNKDASFEDFLSGNSAQSRSIHSEQEQITFDDIIGGVPEEIQDLMAIFQEDAYYKAVGIEAPKGILFVGPPGTGKTMLARALAGELKYAFLSVSGSDFIQIWVGQGAENIRKLFEKAREKIKNKESEKVIIFIDEIDAIGRRGSTEFNSGAQDEVNRTINELLRQMDGLFTDAADAQANKNIIVIGATNFEQSLDPALKRAGRFGRIVHIPLPDTPKRAAIIHYYIKKKHRTIETNVSIAALAEKTISFNCADLMDIVERAAVNAARSRRSIISSEDFEKALREIKQQKKNH